MQDRIEFPDLSRFHPVDVLSNEDAARRRKDELLAQGYSDSDIIIIQHQALDLSGNIWMLFEANEKIQSATPEHVFTDTSSAKVLELLTSRMKSGDDKQVVQVLRSIIEKDGGKPGWFLLLAQALFKNKNGSEAIKVLRESLKSFPEDANLHFIFGNILGNFHMFYEAIVELQEAIRLGNDGTQMQVMIGFAFRSIHDPREAFTHLKRAFEGGIREPLFLFEYILSGIESGQNQTDIEPAMQALILVNPVYISKLYLYGQRLLGSHWSYHGPERAASINVFLSSFIQHLDPAAKELVSKTYGQPLEVKSKGELDPSFLGWKFMHELGARQIEQPDLDAALKSFQAALLLYEEDPWRGSQHSKAEGALKCEIGLIYHMKQNYAQSLKIMRELYNSYWREKPVHSLLVESGLEIGLSNDELMPYCEDGAKKDKAFWTEINKYAWDLLAGTEGESILARFKRAGVLLVDLGKKTMDVECESYGYDINAVCLSKSEKNEDLIEAKKIFERLKGINEKYYSANIYKALLERMHVKGIPDAGN